MIAVNLGGRTTTLPGFQSTDLSYHAESFTMPAAMQRIQSFGHILRDIGASISPFNAWVTLWVLRH